MTPSEEIKARWALLRRDREMSPEMKAGEMEKDASATSNFWQGFEKSAGAGRADRLLAALRKKPALLPEAHKAVRSLDLKNQARGLNEHVETAVRSAIERVKKTKDAGGFAGTKL